jgi:hypothetical protein
MLTVNEAQIESIQTGRMTDFVARMVTELRVEFPDRSALFSEAEMTTYVKRGIDSSRRYGVDRVIDVERYLFLMWALGFDTEVGWVREVLGRPDFSGRVRVDVLWATYLGNTLHQPGQPFVL